MKYILKTFFFIILVVSLNTTFSEWKEILEDNTSTWIIQEKIKTIKELKQEVKTNTSKIEKTDQELDNLQKELLVKKFFKVNLNLSQKAKLNKIIIKYRKTKELLNNEIILKSKNFENNETLKKELLENEKNFYWSLIEYIDTTKYTEYIDYIKQNIIIVNKKTNLESNSATKEVIIQNKVDNIKEKIKKQNEITNDNTIQILNFKINRVLTKLTNKEKFINLPKEWKIKLFESLILKIKTKLEILDKKIKKSQTQEILIKNKDKIIENIKEFQDNILK